MVRRLGVTTAMAVVLLAFVSGPASPALWLEFKPTHAAPGTVVVGETAGRGAAPVAAGEQLPAYIVPSGAAVDSPDDDSVEHIGAVRVDENGDGHIRFEVPDLGPGSYIVFLDCQPCTPPGFAPAGEFEISAVAGGHRQADDGDVSRWVFTIIGLGVASVVAVFVASRRRNRQPS